MTQREGHGKLWNKNMNTKKTGSLLDKDIKNIQDEEKESSFDTK
jgi:hypothetical protein